MGWLYIDYLWLNDTLHSRDPELTTAFIDLAQKR
jgi:hypothetical protein